MMMMTTTCLECPDRKHACNVSLAGKDGKSARSFRPDLFLPRFACILLHYCIAVRCGELVLGALHRVAFDRDCPVLVPC